LLFMGGKKAAKKGVMVAVRPRSRHRPTVAAAARTAAQAGPALRAIANHSQLL